MSLAKEDRDADHFKFQGDVTQSAAYIHGSDLWKKVTTRLGTDITRYLLESCSVFVAVPPSCVFQVCGIPVYDRVSMTTNSSGFRLQRQFSTQKRAPFGRHHKAVTLRKKHMLVSLSSSKKKIGIVRGKNRKRKRETDQKDEEENVTSSGKRRRVSQQEPQVCYETVGEGQPVEASRSMKIVEHGNSGFKVQTSIPPLEGAPSWRSGIFPPLPPSQIFIRTLGILYGARGMRSFLLNRKKKTADGPRRLQGKDLIRIVFFEGLPYLNGLERRTKKLPRRFFNMVPLFGQLLQQHRRCSYSGILQRMCPVFNDHITGEGDLNSLLPQHCAPHRVYLFVRECLSVVIPKELWGSDHNRLNFFARVRGFLCSGKFERISLSELMWKMKVNDCDWLKISKKGEITDRFFFLCGCKMYFGYANNITVIARPGPTQ